MNPSRAVSQTWYALCYYMGLAAFAFGLGLLQVAALISMVIPLGHRGQRMARAGIRRFLQAYLGFLRCTGALRVDFAGWQDAFTREPGVIVANHPSMLDAPMLLSRLPRGLCIFKAALGRHVLRGPVAALTGYMHSEEGVDGLRAVVAEVRRGAQFVFFPEGTRTTAAGEIRLRPLYAVVAKYARAPVHVFAIERDTNALCKDHAFWRCPLAPGRFSVRHVASLSPDEAPSAGQLHQRVEAVLRPLVEAHREVLTSGCFARREVLRELPDRIEWRLCLPAGEAFFAGHFPGHPIAPGAAAVHWLLQAWASGPGAGQPPPRIHRVRFLREISPGAEIHLKLEKRPAGWQASLDIPEGPVLTARIDPGSES